MEQCPKTFALSTIYYLYWRLWAILSTANNELERQSGRQSERHSTSLNGNSCLGWESSKYPLYAVQSLADLIIDKAQHASQAWADGSIHPPLFIAVRHQHSEGWTVIHHFSPLPYCFYQHKAFFEYRTRSSRNLPSFISYSKPLMSRNPNEHISEPQPSICAICPTQEDLKSFRGQLVGICRCITCSLMEQNKEKAFAVMPGRNSFIL